MKRAPTHGGHEPSFQKFHGLMPYMVREILLCSAAYDAFLLEEDGRLEERLFSAYDNLSLSLAPRITHASTAERTLELLDERRFDLVITVVRLEDTDAAGLSQRIRASHPTLPIVLLAFDETDRQALPGGLLPATIDREFLWTGDPQILIAAIKLTEDARNAEHDARTAGVQVILVVEDSLRRYSSFLALLYAELMTQSQTLIAEGLNAVHRLMRMRARPKILLATTYEEAEALHRRFRDRMLAVISDVRFPRGGREDPGAGLALVDHIRALDPDLPMLVQSADAGVETAAAERGLWHVNKNSSNLHGQIRRFLKESLGFGDFVFRLPDHTEVARARDLYELEQMLHWVPADSVEYHARHNHFSLWLNARTMFALANEVRPRTVAEFGGAEELRGYLIDVLHRRLTQEEEGVIADFAPTALPGRQFVRLGHGSIGGKGRGIAFANAFLVQHGLHDAFPELDVRIPRTLAVATGEFDRFLDDSGLSRDELVRLDDHEITRRFLAGRIDPDLRDRLEQALWAFEGPLAVRSSSLLEDSRFQPFAGIYATYMLPNNHPDPDVRLAELRLAIKAVFASAFWAGARACLIGSAHALDQEKMAVVIQEVVGTRHGERYYPLASGVAQSRNFYPVGAQRAEDGVGMIALGLGHTVVSGGSALRFSPQSPTVLPQFPTPRDFYRRSQSTFWAIDMSRPLVDFGAGPLASLRACQLEDAEADGSLAVVGSTWSPADDAIRDTLTQPGPRLITFNNLLKWGAVPLAPALSRLLHLFRSGMGTDVEIEFALEMPAPGRDRARLHVVQVRPMPVEAWTGEAIDLGELPAERILCRTERSLGRGNLLGIRDIIYVPAGDLDSRRSVAAAAAVGELNRALREQDRHFLLIGPGRWGSSDPALGIPVDWPQISAARAIVETPMAERVVEPSQGSHFFHNITVLRIAYLTVGGPDELLDTAWLDAQPTASDSAGVRHIRLASPLEIRLGGPEGGALVLKPAG